MASDQRKKGLVKGVPSADTVIFQGPPGKDGIPLEKTLRLNGIRAPVLGDPDRPDRKEEPFAYEAREFLRKKIINKQVFFFTENKVADREYGRIIVDDQDIGEVLLREGYAKFIDDMKPQPVNFDKYTKAADKAYDAKKGVYSEDKTLLASKTRKLVKIEDPQGFVEKRKDKPMKGLVEEFRSGLFSVYLPDIDAIIKLSLNAVIIPIMGFKASQDVRCFIDSNFLQRDVEVTFTSYDDRGGYFVGTIKNVDNPSYNLVRELLKEGYARLNGDAYKLLDPADHRSAKQAQDEAQRAKLRCWFNYEDTKKGSSGVEKVEEYQGRVIEVNSGDSLTVENLKNGEQARVYLANLRAPAIGNPKKGEAPKPWAWEAKEYVRNQTIGKKVRVEVEYSKKIPVRLDEENPAEDKEFTFVSIILPNDKNLSELLVGAGLASVVAPRSDDPFTKYMKQLSEAEEEAKKKKSGQHSSKTPVNPGKFTDYADKRNTQKSRQFFEFVKNEPALAGTVEAVLSGSLFKVRLEKQNCYVLFSLGGIRTLSLEKNVPQYERFAKEAVRFSKDQILQRDVELHLNSCTPKGVFQGALFVAKKNFAHTLLEQGLAYAETASKHEERYAVQYKTVEKVAEEKKIGIWGAGIPIRSSGHTRGNTTKPLNETKTGTVTEVNGPDEFFVQFNAKKGLETIEAELAKGKGTEGKLEQPVKKGIPCIAKFSDDGKWYRARIDKLISSTKFGVVFTDYGNYDEVSYDDIRKISPALLAIEPLATKCALAYCEPSGKRTSTYEEAAERLRELIWEKTITMQFAFEDSTTKYGIASEKKGDIKDSANARLISEGLVRLIEDVVPLPNDQLAYLRDEEEKARAKKLGGWGSNDFQEEDEY